MRNSRAACGVVVVSGLALLVGCGSSSNDAGEQPATTSTAAPSTTGAPSATSSTASTGPSTATTATTAPPSGSTVTTAVLVPGQPCAAGSDPDCIDPMGDGTYVYLIGGAECMASPIGGSMCADLDGDGRAGYPDSG